MSGGVREWRVREWRGETVRNLGGGGVEGERGRNGGVKKLGGWVDG